MKDKISIRAPARGATSCGLASIKAHRISIRAPARGATVNVSIPLSPHLFQSALPRGERQRRHLSAFFTWMNFNPRSREGSDNYTIWMINVGVLFQSALPRGERPSTSPVLSCHPSISIRAPARGATIPLFQKVIACLFQSALPRGERLAAQTQQIINTVFQSALPRGERLRLTESLFSLSAISIRAPARGATYDCHTDCAGLRFQSALPRGERPYRFFRKS